jgi:glutathione S-transferase
MPPPTTAFALAAAAVPLRGGPVFSAAARAPSAGPTTFVTNTRCPFARTTWIALEELSIEYTVKEVGLYGAGGKPQWFLDMNPAGQVPVLEHSGVLVVDSVTILDHLLESYPSSALAVASGSPSCRAARKRIDTFLPAAKADILAGRAPEAASQALEAEMRAPFLAGAEFSAADVRALPFLARVDEEYGLASLGCDKLAEWFVMCKRRPAFLSTVVGSPWWWW